MAMKGGENVAGTVLIVDDSPTIRAFARLFLKGLGVDVLDAEDGAQALLLVHETPPDVCLVDVDMPKMDGLTFTRELRHDSLPAIAALPVVLLTGDATPEAREQGRLAGANDLLEKPIKGHDLQAMVNKYLVPHA
jgi:CheY-like chemotaxis protein